MKTAEEHYYEVCQQYEKHCIEQEVMNDDAKFVELIEESFKAYAREAIAEHLERAADGAVSWIQTPSDRGLAHLEIVSTEIILK